MVIVYEGQLIKKFDFEKELIVKRRFMTDGKIVYGNYVHNNEELTLHDEHVTTWVILEEYTDRFHVLNDEGEVNIIAKPSTTAIYTETVSEHYNSIINEWKEKDYELIDDEDSDYYYNDLFETFEVKDISAETLLNTTKKISEYKETINYSIDLVLKNLETKLNSTSFTI
jgi:hypothetical protein